jgi:large subunit ribosomal protein L29
MKRLKTEELSKLSDEDLVKRLNDLRSELSTLRSKAARGTLKKQLGEIKSVKRNIARALTQRTARMNVRSAEPSKRAQPEITETEEAK